MAKFSLKNRLLQLRISTIVCAILCLTTVIQFFSCYGKYHYRHIPADIIETQLYKKTNPKLVLKKGNVDCKYDHILESKESIENWQVPKSNNEFVPTGVVNGSYAPDGCNPLYSVAMLVTYRNRQSQLDVFLPYMHNFLRRQNIHYKIYLIEQQDEKPWNKGVLYNVGAQHALADRFPCLVLHDVDLLPLDAANLYACGAAPRHMSASIDKFRYVLPYDTLVGGVTAITADQYVAVNGFSNNFEGWGGEDDDFAARLEAHQLEVVRFPRSMSRYTMLVHRQEPMNEARLRVLAANRRRPAAADGLSTVRRHHAAARRRPQRLATLLGVQL